MIVDEKLWEEQRDFERGNILLRKHHYDLIISGDNHQTLLFEHDGRHLINCGSLLRTSIDQIEHRPCIFRYNTETKELRQEFIPIETGINVFNREQVEAKKENNAELDLFIASLKDTKVKGMSFVRNLNQYLKDTNQEEPLQNLVNDLLTPDAWRTNWSL